MASFTDNIQALTTFKPYVQQNPVDAMVNVGMQKQAQYEAGVQKIQSDIDKVAGMDIVRDIDKQYLQSKLNELGGKLRTVAAGDFSNFQLVNSVGGMVNSVAKDKNVQNAAYSTAKYRKEVAAMETAKKEGKSAIQNEWDFSNRANRWLSSTNLQDSFNESYTPFIDVNKKWLDVVKGLHSDLQDVDIAYEMNPDGTPNYAKTLAAMQRVSKESVSSAKIENSLRANLSPEELNQLSIDGRFQFRNETPETLINHSKVKFNSLIRSNEEAIKSLQGLADLSTSNAGARKRALDSIKQLEEQNKQLQNQLIEEIDFVTKNPEEAKAYIYKNGAIAQFAQAYSWEHNKNNLLTNPVQAQQNWEKNYAMDKAEFNLELAKFDWQKYKDTFDINLKAQKQQQELYGSVSDAVELYGGESTQVKSPLVALRSEIQSLETSSKTQKAQFLKGNPNVSPAQLENLIADYKEGKDVMGKSAQTLIPEKWKSKFYNIVETDNQAYRKKTFLDNTIREADESEEMQKAGVAGQLSPELIQASMVPGTSLMAVPYSIIEQRENKRNEIINNLLNEKTGVYVPRLVQIKTGKTESGDGETAAKINLDQLVLGKIQQYEGGKMGIKGGSEEFREEDVAVAREMLKGENRKNIMYQKLTQGDKTFLVVSDGTKEAIIPIESNEMGFLPVDPNEPTPAYKELYQTQAFNEGQSNPSRTPELAYFQRYKIPNTKLDVRGDIEWDMSDTSINYPIIHLNLGDNDWLSITVPKGLSRDAASRLITELTDSQIKQLFLNDPTISDEDKERIKNLK